MTDERIIREAGMDARVASVIEPVMEGLGFRLVRVRLSGQNGLTLQIMAERFDGTMNIEDCEELSRALSPVLDVDDPVDRAYNLEVSSPGIDRPLVRRSDFDAWKGHLAKLETSRLVSGRKRFRGPIVAVGSDRVTIGHESSKDSEAAEVEIPFEALADARLVLTDDLVRDALKLDRKLRRERKKSRGATNDSEQENTG